HALFVQRGEQLQHMAGGGDAAGGANGEFPGGGMPGGTGGTARGGMGGGGMGGGGMGGGPGGGMGGADSELITYLEKHQDGATWLLAVSNSQSAGQLILSSGKPVISMWGFTGSDRAMTLAKLKELVKKGELHYIQLGGGGMGMGGDNSLSQEITTWVQKHGTAVKESAYAKSAGTESESASDATAEGKSDSPASDTSDTSNTSTVYRLDPADVG
ncbi:hypothetical protein ABTX35_27635, partial [Streptomyces sp. NPDC096080]